MTEDEILIACEWSDYKKDYGVKDVHREYIAFRAGFKVGRGETLEPGVLR